MNRFYVVKCVFFCVFCITNFVFSNPLDVSVDIIPRATYTLNELYVIMEEKQNLEHVGSITIQNNTSTVYEVVLRVQLFLDKYSTTEPIADYVTNYNNFPILVPVSGTYYIDNLQITEEMVRGGQSIVSKDQVENRVKNTFGDDIIIKTAGLVPEGKYIYKVYVYDKDDTSLSTPLASVVEESFDMPLEDGVIDINTPENNVVLSDNYPINFIWQNLLVRAGVNIYYTFNLWEKGSYSLEEVVGLDPLFQKTLETPFQDLFSYDSNYVELKKGKAYVWQLTALDGEGYPIGNFSASIPYEFVFGEKTMLKVDGLRVFDSYPIVFSWEGAQNLEYTVYISQNESLSDAFPLNYTPVLATQLNVNQLPDQFYPGASYYWKVVAIEDDSIIESNVGMFSIKKQNISLVNPLNEVIDSEYIQFIWEGDSSNIYKLYLSDSNRFKSESEYKIESNMALISKKDLSLIPGKTYYWKVVHVNEYGNELAESQIGYFSTPEPLSPELYYPLDNQNVFQGATFSYKNLEWASSYKINIMKDNKSILSKETTKSSIDIDLTTLKLNDKDTLSWFIEASNASFKIASEEKSFVFSNPITGTEKFKNNIKLMRPLNSMINGFEVEFQWTGDPQQTYEIQVSKTDRFSNPITFSVRNKLYLKAKISLTGKVYWRVVSNMIKSNVGVFVMSNNLSDLTKSQQVSIQNMIISKVDDMSNLKEGSWKMKSIKKSESTTVDDLIYLSKNSDMLVKVIEL